MTWAFKLIEKKEDLEWVTYKKGKPTYHHTHFWIKEDDFVLAVLEKNKENEKEVIQFVKDAKQDGYDNETCESIRKARQFEAWARAFRELVHACKEVKK